MIRVHRLPAVPVALLLALAAGCQPAEVVTGNCKSTLDCPSGKVCLNGVCQQPGLTPCVTDQDCEELGGRCVNNYCTAFDVDAGILDHDAPDSRPESSIPTGDGIISIVNDLPIDFGSPFLGVAIERVLTIKNVGTTGLRLLSVHRDTGTTAEFALSPEGAAAAAVIEAGLTADVVITYTLADGEADIGLVVVESDAVACQPSCPDPTAVPVPLYSEFKGARNLLVTPASSDFGFIASGSNSMPSIFHLINNGTLEKVLTIGGVSLDGTDLGQFKFVEDPTPPYYVVPGQHVDVRIQYTPRNTATHRAELVVTANSDDPARQEVRVPLTGRSIPPAALEGPPSLDFGNVQIGQTKDLAAIIFNGGGSAATILSPERYQTGSQSTQGFGWISPPLPQLVTPGGDFEFTVRFAPLVAGALSDALLLDHDAGSTPLSIQLTGTGVEPPQGFSSLRVEQRFSRTAFSGGTQCTFQLNQQNVDLEVETGGIVCDKNFGGCNADVCGCDYGARMGTAVWSCNNCGGTTANYEQVASFGSGGDGQFIVRAFYFDSCTARYPAAVYLQPICSFPGTREACFPVQLLPDWYPDGVHISETQCLYGVAYVGGRCMANAPTKVRTTVYLTQGTRPDQTVHFCTDLATINERQQVVRIDRIAGLFNIIGPLGNTRQIGAMDPCGQ
ncbi:MAG: choice-of-anchor D domain-containing protein [Deltaproteobacteria bacterium]|nr:choice-of-anchor D domain-containing protein [Deltaproteobacteria bacterium]